MNRSVLAVNRSVLDINRSVLAVNRSILAVNRSVLDINRSVLAVRRIVLDTYRLLPHARKTTAAATRRSRPRWCSTRCQRAAARCASPARCAARGMQTIIEGLLPGERPGMTAERVLEAWPEATRRAEPRLQKRAMGAARSGRQGRPVHVYTHGVRRGSQDSIPAPSGSGLFGARTKKPGRSPGPSRSQSLASLSSSPT